MARGGNRNCGKTFPFAPPELYRKDKVISEEIDVYSMGVCMYWCIFDQHIWGYIGDRSRFETKLGEDGGVMPQLIPEHFESYQMGRMLKILLHLCLRCLNWC